jgi:hypothetical protein
MLKLAIMGNALAKIKKKPWQKVTGQLRVVKMN